MCEIVQRSSKISLKAWKVTTSNINETMIDIATTLHILSNGWGSWVEDEYVEFEIVRSRVVIVIVGIWNVFEGDGVVEIEGAGGVNEFALIVVVLDFVDEVVFDVIIVLPAKENFEIKSLLGRETLIWKKIS